VQALHIIRYVCSQSRNKLTRRYTSVEKLIKNKKRNKGPGENRTGDVFIRWLQGNTNENTDGPEEIQASDLLIRGLQALTNTKIRNFVDSLSRASKRIMFTLAEVTTVL